MDSQDFKKILDAFGNQQACADALGVDQSQISRWSRGLQPIPKFVDARFGAYLNPKTDIDRLHKIILNEAGGRRSDKAFLKCHEIAGVMSVTDVKVVLVFLNKMADVNRFIPMLKKVLEEHLIFTHCFERFRLALSNGVEIRITTPDRYQDKDTLGLSDYYVCDVTYEEE